MGLHVILLIDWSICYDMIILASCEDKNGAVKLLALFTLDLLTQHFILHLMNYPVLPVS